MKTNSNLHLRKLFQIKLVTAVVKVSLSYWWMWCDLLYPCIWIKKARLIGVEGKVLLLLCGWWIIAFQEINLWEHSMVGLRVFCIWVFCHSAIPAPCCWFNLIYLQDHLIGYVFIIFNVWFGSILTVRFAFMRATVMIILVKPKVNVEATLKIHFS